MARYHQIDSAIWEDLQEHNINEKILYIYTFSNPSTRESGLYKISMPTILLNTGLDKRGFEGALKGLEGMLYYDPENKVIFVVGKFKRRLSGIEHNLNVVKGIKHDLELFSKSPLKDLFLKKYGFYLKGLGSPSIRIPLHLPLEGGLLRGKQVINKVKKWQEDRKNEK